MDELKNYILTFLRGIEHITMEGRNMKIEMGESLIYSWLRHEKLCQLVQTTESLSLLGT